jgi:hypothetical protein
MAGSGNDEVTGGRGIDAIFGEAGLDKVWGNYGDDFIDGGADGDEITGQAGDDKVFGDLGNDTLWGGDNDDYLIGGDGVDWLLGGKGSDRLDGSLGWDHLNGQDGGDYFHDATAFKYEATYDSDYSMSPLFMGWFDRSLQDASLRTAARFAYAPDTAVNRFEMMDILDAAGDGGWVDNTEFVDLQEIVGATQLNMPAHVQFLADKVVNGDWANTRFQGAWISSLEAGDSSSKLDMLVDKWFRGLDRPLAQYVDWQGNTQTATYQYVAGSLFQDGISYADISQGQVGNCYFLAALGSVALQEPSAIQDMFIDNKDGTYTVGFHKSATEMHYVTVDRYLPTVGDDRIFASFGTDKDNASNELWVALVEKAYAQANESNWIGQDYTNSYQGIASGISSIAVSHLTGWSTATSEDLSFKTVVKLINSGAALTVGSRLAPPDIRVVGLHAYTLLGYNATTGRFTVFNPWGFDRTAGSLSLSPATFELTWDEMVANFSQWGHATFPAADQIIA